MPHHDGEKHIALEEDKVRQTSHWDMDYLPRKEVEARYARPTTRPAQAPVAEERSKPMTSRQLGIICMVAGLVILALAVAAARYLSG
jgi:hypothetical protein